MLTVSLTKVPKEQHTSCTCQQEQIQWHQLDRPNRSETTTASYVPALIEARKDSKLSLEFTGTVQGTK